MHCGARPRAAKRNTVPLAGGIGGDHRDVGPLHAAFRACTCHDFDFQLPAHALRECTTTLPIWTEHGYPLDFTHSANPRRFVRASRPEPITATRRMSGLAMYFVATPVVAPVRAAVK